MVDNVILKIRAGSHLYGLNTENSDEDFIGIYLNTPEEMLGLNSSEIIDDSIISKREDCNKNTKDAVDCTYYELRKYCRLALNANPTMLEVMFADEKNIIECTDFGKQLIESRHKFLSTKIKHSYIGYAFSQKKKSQVKTENLRDLYFARDVLAKLDKNRMLYDYLEDLRKSLGDKNWNHPDYIQFGDLRFNNQKIKDAIQKIDNRIDKASHRADGMLEHGLDYKFISHTLRLLVEGEELLLTGDLSLPVKERELLMSIKKGELKPSEVMKIIDERENKLEKIHSENISPLPYKPDFNAVNDMVIDIYSQHLKDFWKKEIADLYNESAKKRGW